MSRINSDRTTPTLIAVAAGTVMGTAALLLWRRRMNQNLQQQQQHGPSSPPSQPQPSSGMRLSVKPPALSAVTLSSSSSSSVTARRKSTTPDPPISGDACGDSGRSTPATKEALQVAGHGGILYSPAKAPGESETAILRKPTKPQEAVVYKDIFERADLPEEAKDGGLSCLIPLRPWVPQFHDTFTTEGFKDLGSSRPSSPVPSPKKRSCEADDSPKLVTTTWVEIENLCDGYIKPCVMDLKLGCIRYTPLTSPEEVVKIERKEGADSARVLQGFRIAGLHQSRQLLGRKERPGALFPKLDTAAAMDEEEELEPPGGMGSFARTKTFTAAQTPPTKSMNSEDPRGLSLSPGSTTSSGLLPEDFLEVKSFELRSSAHKEVYRKMDRVGLENELSEFCTVQELKSGSMSIMSSSAGKVPDPHLVEEFAMQISQIIQTLEENNITDHYSFTACSLLLVYDAAEELNSDKGRARRPTMKARLIDFGKSGRRDPEKFFPDSRVGFLRGLKNILSIVESLKEQEDE